MRSPLAFAALAAGLLSARGPARATEEPSFEPMGPPPAHCSSARPSPGEGPALRVVSRRYIDPSRQRPAPRPGDALVPLSAAVQAGSGWERPGVLEAALGRASQIFSQCGAGLGEVEVLSVSWSPPAYARVTDENADPYCGPRELSVISDPALPASRPAAFLFASGASIVPAGYGRSIVEAHSRAGFPAGPLFGSLWISYSQQTERDPSREEAASFSLLAHELAHILGDLQHVPERDNLMSNVNARGAKTGRLNTTQCEAILAGARSAAVPGPLAMAPAAVEPPPLLGRVPVSPFE